MLRTADKRLMLGQALHKVTLPYRFPGPMWDDGAARCISTWSAWGLGPAVANGGQSTAWPATNDALFWPFRVPYPVTVEKLAIGTGATAGGNFDVGIFDKDGNKLVSSGSTGRAGASQGQIVDVTDTLLLPGLYYFGMSCDGTSTFANAAMVNLGGCKMVGMRKQASGFPLPSTATFATVTANYLPLVAAYISPAIDLLRAQPSFRWPPLNVITPYHPEGFASHIRGTSGQMGTSASSAPGANTINFGQIRLWERATAVKMTYIVGATSNGNVDLGIYDVNGTRLVNSGSTGQGSTNTIQELDITDTVLEPGIYYLAIQHSSGTGTHFRQGGSADEFYMPSWRSLQNAAGAFGLPSTVTFTDATSTTGVLPVIGVNFSTLV